MANRFRCPESYDHKIEDENGRVVGEIRVKAGGILWAPSGAHKWLGVKLEEFAEFMTQNGTPQKM